MEKIEVEGVTFHKFCFKCDTCQRTLSLSNYASLQGVMFCKPHLKQKFQLKGEYLFLLFLFFLFILIYGIDVPLPVCLEIKILCVSFEKIRLEYCLNLVILKQNNVFLWEVDTGREWCAFFLS